MKDFNMDKLNELTKTMREHEQKNKEIKLKLIKDLLTKSESKLKITIDTLDNFKIFLPIKYKKEFDYFENDGFMIFNEYIENITIVDMSKCDYEFKQLTMSGFNEVIS